MKQVNSIYKEIEKVNAIIEDCYSFLKRNTHKNQERIKSLLKRAMSLRDHYVLKLKKLAGPSVSPDQVDNVEFQVQEQYGRLMGF